MSNTSRYERLLDIEREARQVKLETSSPSVSKLAQLIQRLSMALRDASELKEP